MLLYRAATDADRDLVETKHVRVVATWQSEHLVELADEDGLDDLVELLQAHSNVKLVGYTAQPLSEVVDAAIDELLDE